MRLSQDDIVDAAVELLDAEGEDGLTFRALATHLKTGSGAIYWHVKNKDELLALAAHEVVLDAIPIVVKPVPPPATRIRNLALAIYDAVDAHPWVGAQLMRAPRDHSMLSILEEVGLGVRELGLSESAQFTAAMTLVSYIVGESIKNAANGRMQIALTRDQFLAAEAAKLGALDPGMFGFVSTVVAKQLPTHDDRAEFLAGLDMILAGISAAQP